MPMFWLIAQRFCARQFLRDRQAMIYAAASVWLTVVVLLAWGVHHLWSGMAKPKAVNGVLLPGTLIAQLGHIVGLLITGGTVNNTALMRGDEKGAPATDPSPQPKIPVIGPMIVALLPMAALGAALYLVITRLGIPVLDKIPKDQIPAELPGTMGAFWNQLRGVITLAEGTLNAVRSTESVNWRILAFVYLLICLTVRMAPLPGNIRGHVGAIAFLGVTAWLMSTVTPGIPELILQAWPVLSLAIGTLLLLLFISLVVRGLLTALQMMMATG
jgi:hypothetical protein